MCVNKRGFAVFDPDRILDPDRIAAARKQIRNTTTPKDKLAKEVEKLFRFCVRRLPKAFEDNKLKMEGFVDLPKVYPQDVIDGVVARFKKADFVVEYTFQDDEVTYDHLGFTPPADWVERLLTFASEGDVAMDKAAQSLIG